MAKPEEREYASIRDYAESRKLQPQLVHYYVRKLKIVPVECACCGCKVIHIKDADEVLGRGGPND